MHCSVVRLDFVCNELCSQVGVFTTVTPEAIKAQDGDTGINQPVVYSIIAGKASSTLLLTVTLYL